MHTCTYQIGVHHFFLPRCSSVFWELLGPLLLKPDFFTKNKIPPGETHLWPRYTTKIMQKKKAIGLTFWGLTPWEPPKSLHILTPSKVVHKKGFQLWRGQGAPIVQKPFTPNRGIPLWFRRMEWSFPNPVRVSHDIRKIIIHFVRCCRSHTTSRNQVRVHRTGSTDTLRSWVIPPGNPHEKNPIDVTAEKWLQKTLPGTV